MNKYILDTSALLAFIENEEGAFEVEELFTQALDDKVEISISVISCIEVGYVSWQEQGETVARERLRLIDDLPVSQEAVDERLIETIAGIKATRAMSFADSCIAGLAKFKQAKLDHKDSEYEQIENDIEQLKLPYKQHAKHEP